MVRVKSDNYRDYELKQLKKLQAAEKKKSKIIFKLDNAKTGLEERQLFEFLLKQVEEEIYYIRRQNLINRSDCLSCRMTTF